MAKNHEHACFIVFFVIIMTFVYFHGFGRRALRVFRSRGQVARGEYVKTNFFDENKRAKPQRGDRPSSAFATQLYVSMLCAVSIAYYIPLLYRTLYSNVIAHLCRCIIIIIITLLCHCAYYTAAAHHALRVARPIMATTTKLIIRL